MNATPEAARGAGSRCARCGATFECGLEAGAEPCWCAALPPLEPVPGEGCLCPACLAAVGDAIAARPDTAS